MSRHHSTQAFRVHDLIKQVNSTPIEDWDRLFDIELQEDDSILDILYEKYFDNLQSWAEFNIQMEFEDDSDRIYGIGDDD